MATLTAATYHNFENAPDDLTGYEVIAASETLVHGQYVQRGTNAGEIRALQDDATTGFAGYMHGTGAAGAQVQVYRRCRLITSVNSTIAVTSEGATVYADSGGTASNNPADSTLTSTSNLPIGKVARVITAGAAGANSVVLLLEADGER